MKFVEVQGAQIPALGLGTWQMEAMRCRLAVEAALAMGYRHIDTAQAYGNEADVGGAVRQSNVPRDDIWLTTKLDRHSLTRDAVHHSTRESLKRLGVDWIDLLLIHWPSPDVPLVETLEAMQRLQDNGDVRYIGVSNFPPNLLGEALTLAPISCVQVEYHPYLDQKTLLHIAQRAELMFGAYSPLARGRVMQDPVIREIGESHGKSPAQVVLKWLVQQHNVAAIPKASSEEHLRANLEIFDFELSAEEARRIAQFDKQLRLLNPEFAPDWSE